MTWKWWCSIWSTFKTLCVMF